MFDAYLYIFDAYLYIFVHITSVAATPAMQSASVEIQVLSDIFDSSFIGKVFNSLVIVKTGIWHTCLFSYSRFVSFHSLVIISEKTYKFQQCDGHLKECVMKARGRM